MFKSANFSKYFIESQFINPPNLLYISKVEKDEWFVTRRVAHMHNHAEIGFVRSGSSVFIIDDEEHAVVPGDLYIYNKGLFHDEQPEKYNLSVYCIGVSHLALPGLPPDFVIPDTASPVVHCAEHFTLLDQLFGYIFEQIECPKAGENAILSHMVMTVLSLISQKTVPAVIIKPNILHPQQDELCHNIKAFIHENYLNDISLQVISDAVAISPYYMSRVFKKVSGYSPMEYVERLRLGKAQVLLIHTDTPIIDIALQTGYNNLSTFNCAFSKLFGVTPKKFKKVYRSL